MQPQSGYNATNNAFITGKRRRINLVAICLNIFMPWFLFVATFMALSFSLHYNYPMFAWSLVVVGVIISIALATMAFLSRSRGKDPMWYTFAAGACFLAAVIGAVIGDINFHYHMAPYYDIQNLNTYVSTNPALQRGQELMDAGQVYFSDGTRLDNHKSIGFKNLDLYCVAPIVNGDDELASYDFWAVGINCCSGVASDFRCGEFGNPHARSGLRLMRDDQRAFYRLAVQQAEAKFKIRATHPLFFTWMQDPVVEMNNYRDNGFKYFLLGIFTHFAFNLFCVVCAVVGFSKIGHY